MLRLLLRDMKIYESLSTFANYSRDSYEIDRNDRKAKIRRMNDMFE